MDSSEEQFLSDVHMTRVVHCDDETGLQLTRFMFSTIPSDLASDSSSSVSLGDDDECTVSDDTDMELPRSGEDRKGFYEEVITIYHSMSTNLSQVGLQVWRGALIMCDFVLHNSDAFKEERVLELGSGTGLTGIILAQHSQHVTCSDTGSEVLSVCRKNLNANERLIKCPVNVVDLNWHATDESESLLTNNELPTCIVACDCVYDTDSTDDLFRLIFRIMKRVCDNQSQEDKTTPITTYVSLEKRINFSLHDKCVVAHEYDNFKSCLAEICEASLDGYQLGVYQINLEDIPKSFSYERVKQLELWKIIAERR